MSSLNLGIERGTHLKPETTRKRFFCTHRYPEKGVMPAPS
jgi:hypothetical protein